ncbi:MAG: acyltransferase family protein, partial [Acidimicrobiia bacterium]
MSVLRPDRSRLLDSLRGVAVAAVVVYHAFSLATPEGQSGGESPWAFLAAGSLGVDLFFVLSGLLLLTSWEATRRRHPGLGAAFADFVRRRALRILPAYWLSLAVLVPLLAPEILASPGRLGLLLTVQQYLDPALPKTVNVVYWSLTTEVHFYLLLPALAFALRRLGSGRFLLACLATSVAWQVMVAPTLPAGWVFGRLDQFAAGMVAARILGGNRRAADLLASPPVRALLGTALVGAAFHLAWRSASGAALPGTWLVHPLAGLSIAGLAVAILSSPSRGTTEH